jgi:hypothetical protein
VALTGSLQEIEPADLIQLIDMGRKSGLLTVTWDEGRTVLHFRDGRLVHAADADGSEPREVVYAFVARRTGSFLFETGETNCPQTLNESTEGLVLEGMRRLDHEQRIQDRLPPPDQPLVLAGARQSGGERELTADQAHVLLAVDGSRVLDQVARESGLSRLAAYEAVAQLLEEGLIQARPPTPEPEKAAARPSATSQSPQAPLPVRPSVAVEHIRRIIDYITRM